MQYTLHLKQGCPYCLKVRIFLLEAKLMDRVELEEFVPGTPAELAIKEKLRPHLTKITFPTLETQDGEFQTESDDIIARFAEEFSVDISKLETFLNYRDYVMKQLSAHG